MTDKPKRERKRMLDEIDRLACDICWSEFSDPKPKCYGGKRRYWKSMPHDRQEIYRNEARIFFRVLLVAIPYLAHSTKDRRER